MSLSERIFKFRKLAQESLSNKDFLQLNFILSEMHGWDSIGSVIRSKGLVKGPRVSKDKYQLLRGDKMIDNAYLVGTHERAQIVLDKVPEPKQVKRKVPWDSHFSPSALYEREEKEREND